MLDLEQMRTCFALLREAEVATGGRVDVTIHGANAETIAQLQALTNAHSYVGYWESIEWDAVRVTFGLNLGELNVFGAGRRRARREEA